MIRVMIIAPKKVREKGRTQRMQSALCISTMKSWKHMRRQLLLLAGQNTLTQRYRWPAGSLPLSSIRVKNMDQCVCVCVILCLMHEVHLGTVLGVPTFLGLLQRKLLCLHGNITYSKNLFSTRNFKEQEGQVFMFTNLLFTGMKSEIPNEAKIYSQVHGKQ